LSWQWPIEGEVTSKFSLSGKVNKGIDVRATAGNAVLAAADGSVVYAGGNLRGYGKLVIVKHDATFLSAYGNNEALTVKEGDTVTKGQEIGRLGGDQVLHFEIRRDGRPEDPEQHLPTGALR
jgi:lipoprotein NlpD